MKITRTLLLISCILVLLSNSVLAMGTEDAENRYYFEDVCGTGFDTGYSGGGSIKQDDPHFGWSIGRFYVDGHTRAIENDENPVFLKNTGDIVTLWFQLEQDITKLNGDGALSVCEDTNGYDEYFGVPKTNFGRGTLIIKTIDYQNHAEDPVVYTDYLAACATNSAAIEVKLCEEGDYEVALNYEICKDNLDIFGWDPFPSYYNYRIFFRFSVRNGNCMIFPKDVVTDSELTNSTITENGFYLDFAKSRYLNVDIKKTIRKEGTEGLVEDVRFNKPAKAGEQYTEEGIYTIKATNVYTGQTTEKVIYVGTDDVLKAHVTEGLTINEVERQLALGATVSADGKLVMLQNIESSQTEMDAESDGVNPVIIWVGIAVAVVGVGLLIGIINHKKDKKDSCERFDDV